jgi:uncharacterized glyoxalase superfamily protein PhnB
MDAPVLRFEPFLSVRALFSVACLQNQQSSNDRDPAVCQGARDMDEQSTATGSSVIPTVRYRDVPSAIRWLERAFGLQPHRIVPDANGAPLYGELAFGSGMVMVAPIQDSGFGKLMVQPDEVGGAETQICYLVVDDIAAHHARARAAGAEILFDLDIDSNGYSCRDLEGHIWNVGTYDPWAVELPDEEPAPAPRKRRALAACFALVVIGTAAAYFHAPVRHASQLAVNMLSEVPPTIDQAQARQQTAFNIPDDTRDLRDQLAKEQLARISAERHINELRQQVAEERRGRETAEAETRAGSDSDMRASLKVAEAAAAAARYELAQLRAQLQAAADTTAQAERGRDTAERAAKEARDKLAALRSGKQVAEQNARQVRRRYLRERSRRLAVARVLKVETERTSSDTQYPFDHSAEN